MLALRLQVAGLVAVAALVAIGCGQRQGPRVGALNGRVVDGTGNPLAGARVFVIWTAEIDAFADSQRARIRICTTRSLPDGTWHTDAWQAPSFTIGGVAARSLAYLPGYDSRPPHRAVEHLDDGAVIYPLQLAGPGTVNTWDDVQRVQAADCAGKPVTTGESDRPFPAPPAFGTTSG
jgi:hypothetical protein